MKLTEVVEQKDKKGTYASVTFDKTTVDAILKYIKENKISNPLSPNKFHTTLLYSRKHLPNYTAIGKLKQPLKGTFNHFDVWDTQPNVDGDNTKCLVLTFNCAKLTSRHKELMKEHNATWDYPSYIPHITLSYDFDSTTNNLPKFKDDIIITEEHQDELDLN